MQTKQSISYLEDRIVVPVFGGTLMPFPWPFRIGIKDFLSFYVF